MNREKDLNMPLLLDFYGDMLTKEQREAMDYFYNDDLSLAEISETIGITRQGVRNRILKGRELITELESNLGLAKRFSEIKKTLDKINSMLDTVKTADAESDGKIDEIRALVLSLK